MTDILTYEGLPSFFRDADNASLRGQRLAILWSRLRLSGALLAAIGGALSWKAGRVDLWACVALAGFAVTLTAEVLLAVRQPDRDWYAGRALAESAKTLAWRYAVSADPFFDGLTDREALSIMQRRLAQIAEKGADRIVFRGIEADITVQMTRVRHLPFEERRHVYLEGRIRNQLEWYGLNAEKNKRFSMLWHIGLISGEVLAVVLAGGRAFGVWEIDLSGILAAAVASGAAWIGLKQYSTLASAYSVATAELSLSYGRLSTVEEDDWALTVADVEEAISREHTMWLASRSGTAD